MEREKIVQTAGRDALGSFAPDFARYNHLAFEIPGEDGTTEWCEPVSDKLYGELK